MLIFIRRNRNILPRSQNGTWDWEWQIDVVQSICTTKLVLRTRLYVVQAENIFEKSSDVFHKYFFNVKWFSSGFRWRQYSSMNGFIFTQSKHWQWKTPLKKTDVFHKYFSNVKCFFSGFRWRQYSSMNGFHQTYKWRKVRLS